MSIYRNKITYWPIYIFPILFIMMPRPSVEGIHLLTYPGIAFVLSVLILAYLKKTDITKNLSRTYQFGFCLSLLTAVSLLFSDNNSFFSFSHIAKVLLFMIIITFGYLVGKVYNKDVVVKGLLRVTYFLISVQLFIASCQFLDLHVFDIIYSSDKTRAYGSLVRVAGSLGNPNMFGWIMTQLGVFVFLFEESKLKKYLALLLCFSLVILSGSRSMLLLFPLVFLVSIILSNRKTAAFYLAKLPVSLTFISASAYFAYKLLLIYGTHFPYINQLLSVLDSKSFESINSYYLRTLTWSSVLDELGGAENWFKWLFGLGPGSVEVADNDFIYSIANYGLFFSIVQYGMYALFTFYFIKCGDNKFKSLGLQYIFFSMTLGMQSDTLSGWNFPLFCMFYVGIALALREKRSNGVPAKGIHSIIKKRKRYKIVW